MNGNRKRTCVVGSGPNGLGAAIVLAQGGLQVEVFEAEAIPGGGVRTMELTLPGFRHDFGSAVYPLAAGSPFFSSLPLRDHGLEWIHSPAAGVGNDNEVSKLVRDFLGPEGTHHSVVTRDLPRFEHVNLQIPDQTQGNLFYIQGLGLTRDPYMNTGLANMWINVGKSERTRALFAGMAAHSFLRLDESLSGAFGLIMAISAHAVGWPIARGGAQSLTDALCRHLTSLGGAVKTSSRIDNVDQLNSYELILCDVGPGQLLKIAGTRLSNGYKRKLAGFRRGPGIFKVDFALNAPVPWQSKECSRAATVHLGGSFEEIAASESAMRNGQHSEKPFVLFVQPSLFDPSRAPAGSHTAWAYCHVPNGSTVNMLDPIEDQIERFAPGFRDCVLARRTFSPADLESMDANLVGGDISGGDMEISQLLFRPTWRGYATSDPHLYICSSSTPPGGGVHGMCGYHAAKLALKRMG